MAASTEGISCLKAALSVLGVEASTEGILCLKAALSVLGVEASMEGVLCVRAGAEETSAAEIYQIWAQTPGREGRLPEMVISTDQFFSLSEKHTFR